MSQLVSGEFLYVPINVSPDIPFIHYLRVFQFTDEKKTFPIVRRTELLGIHHLTLVDFVLLQISVSCVIFYYLL